MNIERFQKSSLWFTGQKIIVQIVVSTCRIQRLNTNAINVEWKTGDTWTCNELSLLFSGQKRNAQIVETTD